MRPVHGDADAHRQWADLYVQDPQGREVSRRLSALGPGRRRQLEQDRPPAEGRCERAPEQLRDGRHHHRARRRDGGVQAEICHPDVPAGAGRPLRLHLFQEEARPGYALVREEHHGLGTVQAHRLPGRPVRQGRAQPRLLSPGSALPRRLRGHLRAQADRAHRRHPRRPCRTGIPLAAAVRTRSAGEGARRQDHRAGERLELRQRGDAQPQEEAVRRCARAQGPVPGGRPVEGRAGAVQDRHHQDRGQHRLPRLAAGRDQGRVAEAGRLLARHREIACRGSASAEGGGAGEPDLRAAQPQCRPALQDRRHLARRRVEQGRHQGDPEGGADRPVVRRHAQRQLRRGAGGQLPERRQPDRRRGPLAAARGLSARTTATSPIRR